MKNEDKIVVAHATANPETPLTARLRERVDAWSFSMSGTAAETALALCDEVERLTAKLVAIHAIIPPPFPAVDGFANDLTDVVKVRLFDELRARLHATEGRVS